MINNIINLFKGWWHRMFDYKKILKDFDLDIQTSNDILDAIQEWSRIFNMNEPWIDKNTSSLHQKRYVKKWLRL